MLKKYLFLGITLLVPFFLVACGETTSESSAPYRRTEFLLGSYATVTIHTPGKEYALEEVFNRIEELETLLTVNEATMESEIEQINRQAGIEPVVVSDETFELIQRALTYTEQSEGIFNITIGPLSKLWDIGFDTARKPDQEEINEILPLLNYEFITLDKEQQSVFLEKLGMRFDLGGVAKGFVADEITKLLDDHGVDSAIIDLSGDVFAVGKSSRGDLWTIGIQDPNSSRGTIMATIAVENQAVFTSGVYERYFEEDGKTYHHILNSATGFPFDNDITSLTIIADSGFKADTYSTIAFGKGIVEGLAYIESIDGVEAMFIGHEQDVYITSGLRENFRIEDDNFTLK